jgi:hypothetical protein
MLTSSYLEVVCALFLFAANEENRKDVFVKIDNIDCVNSQNFNIVYYQKSILAFTAVFEYLQSRV